MTKCTKCKKQINNDNDDLCHCKTKCVEYVDPNLVKLYIPTHIPNLMMKYSGMKTLDVSGESVSYF